MMAGCGFGETNLHGRRGEMKKQKPPENQLLPNTGSAGKSQDKH